MCGSYTSGEWERNARQGVVVGGGWAGSKRFGHRDNTAGGESSGTATATARTHGMSIGYRKPAPQMPRQRLTDLPPQYLAGVHYYRPPSVYICKFSLHL